MAKIKVLTGELKIGDRFKLLDEVTRHKGTYKITSPPRFERSNNVDFVFYNVEPVDVKPHEANCECDDCEYPEEKFNNSNPIKISKHKYLEELNTFFKNTKFEWEHNGTKFKKLDNFEMNSHSVVNYNLDDIPRHGELIKGIGSVFIVMYHGQLYYTFISGNYFPQMQLFDFFTKQLTSKWTNIKNLAPVMNKDTKQII